MCDVFIYCGELPCKQLPYVNQFFKSKARHSVGLDASTCATVEFFCVCVFAVFFFQNQLLWFTCVQLSTVQKLKIVCYKCKGARNFIQIIHLFFPVSSDIQQTGSTCILLNIPLVQEEESIQPWSIVGQLVKGAYLSSYHLQYTVFRMA